MKHTPEPWDAVCDPAHFDSLSSIVGGNTGGGWRPVAEVTGRDIYEQEANGARIVACVNACAGIDDPADLRKQRDELLAAMYRVRNFLWSSGPALRESHCMTIVVDAIEATATAADMPAIAAATTQPKE